MNDRPDGQRLVILPSYNSGAQLRKTVEAVRTVWSPVWVVVDGSTDGSDRGLEDGHGLRVLRLSRNGGKGAAILHAFDEAQRCGYDHALVMDADGQHPVERVRPFMEASRENPGWLIAGVPVFGPDAPVERVKGRLVGNTLATIETLGRGARDSLFGFRVYPIRPSLSILQSTRGARRFDFDTVLAVRLAWLGVPTCNLEAPVVYPDHGEGGVTHFRYVRDNLLLARVHVGLFFGMFLRIPRLLRLPCR
ncbi:MAG: glycosyltransferase family 2 protein [Terrimicrobiaceae bacterium]|nr:glycosyltransferase family 2 protein [Terrimicrobiaceae bacterium]